MYYLHEIVLKKKSVRLLRKKNVKYNYSIHYYTF